MDRVTIIQRVLPHYRVAFFFRLRSCLLERKVELRLIYGQERTGTVPRSVSLDEPWARRIENRYLRVGRRELVWQPCFRQAFGSALVVVEQSARLMLNYPLLGLSRVGRWKTAFWGHGKNMQSDAAHSWAERVKGATIGQVDWWFAYTNLSVQIVAASGYPRAQITNVENSIDTSELRAQIAACSYEEVSAVRARHGITGRLIGLFCGAMYDHKKLPFLIEACLQIKAAVPDFSAVFVGDGPERQVVVDAAARHEWMHYVGAAFGRELAPYYRMSCVMLMPGLVGLAVVDSFVASLPLFTTELPIHSPEIAYLESGVNGIVTAPTVDAFAAAVIEYLIDAHSQQQLKEGCIRSAAHYTIENMVENFAAGIETCIRRDSSAAYR